MESMERIFLNKHVHFNVRYFGVRHFRSHFIVSASYYYVL